MKNNKIDIKAFVRSYLATAAWVTCDSGECQDFTREAQKAAKEDCAKFIDLVITQFGEEKALSLLTIMERTNRRTYIHLLSRCRGR